MSVFPLPQISTKLLFKVNAKHTHRPIRKIMIHYDRVCDNKLDSIAIVFDKKKINRYMVTNFNYIAIKFKKIATDFNCTAVKLQNSFENATNVHLIRRLHTSF